MAKVIFSHKNGDLVKISEDLKLTNQFYNIVPLMKDMINKTFRIDMIYNEEKIQINNCYWHPNDLIPVAEKSEVVEKTFIFDPANLIL